MNINPLLPFFPDSISFLIYGLITGLFLKFWRIAKKNIFVILFFLYAYAVWLASMAFLMLAQTTERQAWFICGFILTFFRPFSILKACCIAPFAFVFERIRDAYGERQADRQDREREEWRERSHREQTELFREEQAKREAEA